MNLKSATKPFNVLIACTRPLITELSDKLRLKHPLLPTISPYARNATWDNTHIIPISYRCYPKKPLFISSKIRSFHQFLYRSENSVRTIKGLTQENISYTSDTGKNYDFNTADTLNTLLLNCMFASGQLKEGEKYDAKPTYKKFSLYKDIFALIGWKTEVINGIVFELNSILVEKWKGKAYRLFFLKRLIKKAKNSRLELLFWVSRGCGSRWLQVT